MILDCTCLSSNDLNFGIAHFRVILFFSNFQGGALAPPAPPKYGSGYAQVPLLSSPWEGSVQDQSLPVYPLPLVPQVEGLPSPSLELILESPLLTSLLLTALSSVVFNALQSTWIMFLHGTRVLCVTGGGMVVGDRLLQVILARNNVASGLAR